MTQELHRYIKELYADIGDYLTTDEEIILNVKIPSSYGELPELSEIDGPTMIEIKA